MDQVRLLDVGQRPSRPRRPGGQQPAARAAACRGCRRTSAPAAAREVAERRADLGPAQVVGRAGPPLGVRVQLAEEQPRVARATPRWSRGAGGQVDPGRDQQQVRRLRRRRGRAASSATARASPPPAESPASTTRRRRRPSGATQVDERLVRVAPGVLGRAGSPAAPPGRRSAAASRAAYRTWKGRSAPRSRRRAGRPPSAPGAVPRGVTTYDREVAAGPGQRLDLDREPRGEAAAPAGSGRRGRGRRATARARARSASSSSSSPERRSRGTTQATSWWRRLGRCPGRQAGGMRRCATGPARAVPGWS